MLELMAIDVRGGERMNVQNLTQWEWAKERKVRRRQILG